MARCEVCGNDYDKAFQITRGDESHTFDSFECAIHAMAPSCEHCGCKVVGHGVEANGSIYCCAHCAQQAGHSGVSDRTGSQPMGTGGASVGATAAAHGGDEGAPVRPASDS